MTSSRNKKTILSAAMILQVLAAEVAQAQPLPQDPSDDLQKKDAVNEVGKVDASIMLAKIYERQGILQEADEDVLLGAYRQAYFGKT